VADLLAPDTALADVSWIPKNRHPPLARLGLETLADLLRHTPRRLEDRRRFDRFPDDEMDRAVCLFGVVTKTALKRFGGGKRMFEITVEDEAAGVLGQPVTCRWFNLPYVQKLIANGQHIVVFGRPKKRGRQVVIDHPEFEVIEPGEEPSIHLNRIVPIHPAGDGITPRVLRSLVHRALAETDLDAVTPLHRGPLAGALRDIHFPADPADWTAARARLVEEEFLGLQAILQSRRAAWAQLPGSARAAPGTLFATLRRALPFPLTRAQDRVIAEIRADLAAPRRMNRLLQGDVGSGKTLVALAAMLLAVEADWQAALMAPTQILAEQHYLNFRRWLDPLGVTVALRTGARREGDAAQILIGTHALLYEDNPQDRIGLVVVDEQHKFGVLQRARLIGRGDAPDVLVLTATPIPRTLTQTLYGDLDVSLLDEKPAERGVIQTAVRDAGKLPEVVEFVRRQLDKGRQAYIVYPLVEDSEKVTAKSALAEFEKWKPLLAPHRIGLLHGRLRPEEKDAVMAEFRAGSLSALVATTVIEVGVDVPNANLMVVENAERFGLAQLHQLRGRIGRGAHKSYCVLLHDPKAEAAAREKLLVLEETTDGFVVAEADWRQRGAGDLLGTAQTGLPPLRLGDLVGDADVMQRMAAVAAEIYRNDPGLNEPAHRALRDFVTRSAASEAVIAG
jgi:ATP-dependent DNA helicase RecG